MTATSAPVKEAKQPTRLATKTRLPGGDRITLKAECSKRIDEWIAKASSKRRGVTITRTDFINWLIMSHPLELSRTEEADLCGLFFDELRFLGQAMRDLRRAKSDGAPLDLTNILSGYLAEATPRTKHPKATPPGEARRAPAQKKTDHLTEPTPSAPPPPSENGGAVV